MSSFAALIIEWSGASGRDWGSELDYPEKAAFVEMQGGSVGLPPAEVDRIERIGKAIYRAGRVERLVIDAYYRRHSSYYRIAEALSKMLGRKVRPEEVSKLLANAVRKAEAEYSTLDELPACI